MKCFFHNIVVISVMVAFLSIGLCLSPILSEETVQADSPPTITTFAGYICYDGVSIWVANYADNNVTKLRVSDKTILGTYNVGIRPWRLCSDGNNIWVANSDSHNITKLRASDGTILGTYNVGSKPSGICSNGNSIWVTNYGNNNVTRLRASDGTMLGTYDVGSKPSGICSDGNSIWVTNNGSHNVTKLRASDGSIIGTYPVGSFPHYICFDGVNIWVINAGSNNVMKLQVADGGIIDTYATDGVVGICFDGANIWVVNAGSMTVTRLPAIPPAEPSPKIDQISAPQIHPNILPIIISSCIAGLAIFLLIRLLKWRIRKRDELFERVCKAIKEYVPPPRHSPIEIAYHWALFEYLRSKFGNKVELETRMEDGARPDITIDHVAIEVKGPTGAGDLDTLITKCWKFSQHYKNIIFVLFAPKYRPQKLEQVKAEIRKRYPEISARFIPK